MNGPLPTVGVIGAGTMGAGIAQVAAVHGWNVEVMDVDEGTVRAALDGVRRRLDRLVEKGRLTFEQRDAAASRLLVATGPDCLGGCELVIEAIVEDLEAKAEALGAIVPALRRDAILATNTSSLSVTRLGRRIGEARRTVGMHFFNPAPIMRLVEIVAGDETDEHVVARAVEIATGWGKHVARAADVPGFIVNHVARPYYLEAFRVLEDGHARADEIDRIMTEIGGFRMGPLELTDLIGQDVNAATTRSVWEQLGRPPLLHPSALQERLVAEGHLGRKTDAGVYAYENDRATPRLEIETAPPALRDDLRVALQRFVARAAPEHESDDFRSQFVFARILVAIIAQAVRAHERGVASRHDIDMAMEHGTNYPKGPFAWADAIGFDVCADLLVALDAMVDDGRFAVPELLAHPV